MISFLRIAGGQAGSFAITTERGPKSRWLGLGFAGHDLDSSLTGRPIIQQPTTTSLDARDFYNNRRQI